MYTSYDARLAAIEFEVEHSNECSTAKSQSTFNFVEDMLKAKLVRHQIRGKILQSLATQEERGLPWKDAEKGGKANAKCH